MAELLRTDQASISKIENRTDMLLSTLRSYVEAMGGRLRLIAEFRDGVAELLSIGEIGGTLKKAKGKAKAQTKRRRPELVHSDRPRA
jgi:hypothetical protein